METEEPFNGPEEIRKQVYHHSSELCRLIDSMDAFGLNNCISVLDDNGVAVAEFEIAIRKRKPGARRGRDWNRSFAAWLLMALPTLTTTTLAVHAQLPVWQFFSIAATTIIASFCLTQIGFIIKRHD
jgi:hypothetical protein